MPSPGPSFRPSVHAFGPSFRPSVHAIGPSVRQLTVIWSGRRAGTVSFGGTFPVCVIY